jgi:site-specific DNA-methyltransferase (adenine-specific)
MDNAYCEYCRTFNNRRGINELTPEEWARYNTTLWQCANNDGYFASFHPEIPRRLIKYFTFAGDTILDPFMGGGTTLAVARELGRNSFGIECSQKAIKFAERRLAACQFSRAITKIVNGDSRKMPFEDEFFDFIVTSPPYFDIVHYSDDEEQLGNLHNYTEFLNEMVKVFKECYRVLKFEKYFCVVTSDVRKAKMYFPIHIDYVNKLREIGFRLHQILINVFHTSGAAKREACMGYPSNFHPWMVHEYILIFQK